jgi:hypothetical protein
LNKSEKKSVDRAIAVVAVQPAAAAAARATLHRSTLAKRTKLEIEDLIDQHSLWPHLARQHGLIVPRDESPAHSASWPFPRAGASSVIAPPSGLVLAGPAPF